MESLAKQANHNFDDGDFQLFDKNNNEIYFEDSKGFWAKYEYDKNNNNIYYEDFEGFWVKYEFDKNNNRIYVKHSDGFWSKSEYKDGIRIYYENSKGYVINLRPKEI